MKLFAERTSKFQSLVSLIALCAMLALFSLALPGFWMSTTGRVFATLWALLALLMFIAHVRRLSVKERRFKPLTHLGERKAATATRQRRLSRVMRG